jgi:predicted PurR-regulated permease PerM
MLGLTLSYALAPLVDRLQRLRVPRTLGAGAVLLLLVGSLVLATTALRDDVTEFVEGLPAAAQKVREAARAQRNAPESTMQKVQKAAAQLEQAAKESLAETPAERGVTRVQIERPQFNLQDYLWTLMPVLAAAAGQASRAAGRGVVGPPVERHPTLFALRRSGRLRIIDAPAAKCASG